MKQQKLLRTAGAVLLVLSLAVFVWLTGGAVAYGWLLHADHYGAAFSGYGKLYFAAAGAMTAGVILYFCKKDLPAAFCGAAGWLTTLILMLNAIGIAEKNGWTGQTAQSFGRNAAAVWRTGMMWNFVPLLLLLLLCMTRRFSDTEKAKRAEKARAENAAAPSILADEAETAGQMPTDSPALRQGSQKSD